MSSAATLQMRTLATLYFIDYLAYHFDILKNHLIDTEDSAELVQLEGCSCDLNFERMKHQKFTGYLVLR